MGHSHDTHGQPPLLSGLKLLKDCPVCQTNFQQQDICIIDTHENVHLLHVTCSSCTHALLSLFTISQFGMSSVGIATDLSVADATRVLGSAPIHEDEVLAFHGVLSGAHETGASSIEHLFVTQQSYV